MACGFGERGMSIGVNPPLVGFTKKLHLKTESGRILVWTQFCESDKPPADSASFCGIPAWIADFCDSCVVALEFSGMSSKVISIRSQSLTF